MNLVSAVNAELDLAVLCFVVICFYEDILFFKFSLSVNSISSVHLMYVKHTTVLLFPYALSQSLGNELHEAGSTLSNLYQSLIHIDTKTFRCL